MSPIELSFDDLTTDNHEYVNKSVTNEFDYSKFESAQWSELSDREKIKLLQSFGDIYAQSIGLDNAPKIVREHDSSVYGVHNFETNVITINLKNCNNPYEALDTVVHEENHAYQHQCIQKEEGYSEGERALMKSQIGPGYCTNGRGYDIQAIELDSNNVACMYVIENCEQQNEDPEYYRYIQSRVEHYSTVNQALEDVAFCNDIEMRQANIAYSFGCTTHEEKMKAAMYIGAQSRARQRSFELESILKEQYYEASLNYSKELHNQYEALELGNKKIDPAEQLYLGNKQCIEVMLEGKQSIEEKIQSLKNEQREYICTNNMDFQDVLNDSNCVKYREEIKNLEQKYDSYNYHVTELQTDSQMIAQSMGWGESQGEKIKAAKMVSQSNESMLNRNDGYEI